jgi:DNA-binding NarL/FixJ family response regulator
MKKTILIFAILVFVLLMLFQLSKYFIISGNIKIEIIISIIAIVFFIIGVYLNKRSLHDKKSIAKEINYHKIKELEISNREYEVLKAISEGLSNKEIANRLYVTESTIKTHVSNLLIKLNAKRRTQALQIAQELNII